MAYEDSGDIPLDYDMTFSALCDNSDNEGRRMCSDMDITPRLMFDMSPNRQFGVVYELGDFWSKNDELKTLCEDHLNSTWWIAEYDAYDPMVDSLTPTLEPTIEPSIEPTMEPSASSVQSVGSEPTLEPTIEPTSEPISSMFTSTEYELDWISSTEDELDWISSTEYDLDIMSSTEYDLDLMSSTETETESDDISTTELLFNEKRYEFKSGLSTPREGRVSFDHITLLVVAAMILIALKWYRPLKKKSEYIEEK